jgi:8-oxo-dGTP pyrophosphatase MutT (NUDIX family)
MMITFEKGNNCFNYRIVGVAVHENHVLLHRAQEDNFWTFPGGRAELGEPAVGTLKREMREELNTEIEVVRLLWLVENFFTYAEKNCHEIALYFLVRFPNRSKYLTDAGPYQGWESDIELTFQWFQMKTEALAGLPLLPSFLQTELQNLPDSVRHIIHYDHHCGKERS